MGFNLQVLSKPNVKNHILIIGLPGIGNVGKIALDFLVESLKAKKFATITSDSFPNSVFVNEKNLIDLPEVALYHTKSKGKDYFFLGGDAQPVDEKSCFEFCNFILDTIKSYGCNGVVTIGGIALQKIPKLPKVYITGTDKEFIKQFNGALSNIYGVVGPIMGVSGIMLGISKLKKIPSACLLAQTFGHPAYIGVKGSREVLKVINSRFKFSLEISRLSEEIEELEEDLHMRAKKLTAEMPAGKSKNPEVSYFG